jgi:ribosomal protein S18 acetylase RimI-like enzyme
MDKYPQLTVFPEVPGKLVWREEVNTPSRRKLSREERQLGPGCDLPDGIYIVTVSENTPPEWFHAAQLLNLVSAGKRTTHGPGFLPLYDYDSAIAVVNGRVVGGVVADKERFLSLLVPLRAKSAPRQLSPGDPREPWNSPRVGHRRPTVFDLWVHEAHRRRGVARQLLLAIAAHFGRSVGDLGFRVPISPAARQLLRSMGLREVLGCN